MTGCPTCDGRGWMPTYPGDKHGDVCPDCHGALPESVLTGPILRQATRHVNARWTAGRRQTKHKRGTARGWHVPRRRNAG